MVTIFQFFSIKLRLGCMLLGLYFFSFHPLYLGLCERLRRFNNTGFRHWQKREVVHSILYPHNYIYARTVGAAPG